MQRSLKSLAGKQTSFFFLSWFFWVHLAEGHVCHVCAFMCITVYIQSKERAAARGGRGGCRLESAVVTESWGEISFTGSMKSAQTHSHFLEWLQSTSLSCLSNPQKIVSGRTMHTTRTLALVMCCCNLQCFFSFRVWTIILRSYRCSSLVPSSWAGRRRCLTQEDRCHVLNTAPDRLAAGHHSSPLPSRPSTRTRRARTRHARYTGGLRSPLRTCREDRERTKRIKRRVRWIRGLGGGAGRLSHYNHQLTEYESSVLCIPSRS